MSDIKFVLRKGYRFVDVKTNKATDQTQFTGKEPGFAEQSHKFEPIEGAKKREAGSPATRPAAAGQTR